MTHDLALFLPELVLVVSILVVLGVDLIWSGHSGRSLVAGLLGIAISLIATTQCQVLGESYFSGMLSADAFSHFFRLFFLSVSAVTLCYGHQSGEIDADRKGEFFVLVLSATLGMMLLAASTHLLMMYLSLELVSVLSFALAGFQTRDRFSNEAALKYTIFGAAASGFMLYGISLLYGLVGSLQYGQLHAGLMTYAGTAAPVQGVLIFVVVVLMLAGFAYKMSAVPMHMWAPDVYQGAPTPAAAFFTVAPKAAGFAAFIRFFYLVLAEPNAAIDGWRTVTDFDWSALMAVMSAITMTVGNFCALRQENAKRMLAYSSIAHAGYMLMGFSVLSVDGVQSVLLYFVMYYLMNFGAFMIVGTVSESVGGEEIDRFRGLGYRSPLVAVILTLFLFSLTGIPPFAGFLGKFYVFAAVIRGQLFWLAILGLLNTVVSLYYYARLIRAMWLSREAAPLGAGAMPLLSRVVIVGLAIPTCLLILYWEPVLSLARNSALVLLGH